LDIPQQVFCILVTSLISDIGRVINVLAAGVKLGRQQISVSVAKKSLFALHSSAENIATTLFVLQRPNHRAAAARQY
jgi:hypothetical protein